MTDPIRYHAIRYHDGFRWRMEGAAGEVIGYALTAGPFKDSTDKIAVPSRRGRMRNLPGQSKMDPFNVSCFASLSKALYNRYKAQVDASSGTGTSEPDVFEDIDFVKEDRNGTDVEKIRVYDCWCSAYELSELDRTKSDKQKETLEFEGDRFDRIPV